MGHTYGAGLLNKLPSTAVDTEEKQIAALTEFFEFGLVLELYEIVNNKVLRIYGMPDMPKKEWVVDEVKRAEIRHAMTLGGNLPYRYFSFLDGFQMFVPDEDSHGDALTLQLPDGSEFEFAYVNMTVGLLRLNSIHAEVANESAQYFERERLSQSDYVEFHQQIIDEITQCQKAGVVYIL